MKMINDPRLTPQILGELVADPRTAPMVEHWRGLAIAERAACNPAEEVAYDQLVARFDEALGKRRQA